MTGTEITSFIWEVIVKVGPYGAFIAVIYSFFRNFRQDIKSDIDAARTDIKVDMDKFERRWELMDEKFEKRWESMDNKWVTLLEKFHTLDKKIEKTKPLKKASAS